MKKIKTILRLVTAGFLVVAFSVSTFAHEMWGWAGVHTLNNALTNNTFQFVINNGFHMNGSHINYFWKNQTAKSYFQSALNQAFNEWGTISGSETTSQNAHIKISYNSFQPPNAGAVVAIHGGDSQGHLRQGERNHGGEIGVNHDAEIIFYGQSAIYSATEKRQLTTHELGHLWSVGDIYDHCGSDTCICKNRNSIYSKTYGFTTATRHDRNAMYIGINNPWFDDGTGLGWKRWISPGVFAQNEWDKGYFFNSNQRWVENATFTVSFNANGGSVSPSSAATGANGQLSSSQIPTPTRTGYTFAGWFNTSATSGGTQLTTSVRHVANTTYWARWKANTYYVRYNGNGKTSGTMANTTHTYATSSNLRSNTFGRTGYSFRGWATTAARADDGIVDRTNGATVLNLTSVNNATVDLFAVWQGITYTVRYWPNGGTGSMENTTHTYGTAKDLAPLGELGFSRVGHTFAGWAEEPNATSRDYNDQENVVNLRSTQGAVFNLYAVWSIQTHTISYHANGGTGTAPEAQKKEWGSSEKLSANTFTAPAPYTITYNANGGTVSSSTKTVSRNFTGWSTLPHGAGYNFNGGQTYSRNAAATMYAQWNDKVGALLTPTRSGQNFAGWYTAATGGTQVTSTDSILRDTEIFARWTAQNVYTIIYNANGGTNSPTSSRKIHGTAMTLTSTTPTRAGYTFLGWSTSSTASTPTYYRSANSGTYAYSANANVTLYAVWCKRGDVTQNGVVDIFDVLEILKYITNMNGNIIGPNALWGADAVADVIREGEINIFDSLEILKYIVGIDNVMDA